MSKRDNSFQDNNFLDYTKLGTVGRRAGVEIPDNIQRDQYGMEDVDAFFSSNNDNDGRAESSSRRAGPGSSRITEPRTNLTPDRSSRIEKLSESIRKMRSSYTDPSPLRSSKLTREPLSSRKSQLFKETPPVMSSKYDDYDIDNNEQIHVITAKPNTIKLPEVDQIDLSFINPSQRTGSPVHSAYTRGFDAPSQASKPPTNTAIEFDDDSFVHQPPRGTRQMQTGRVVDDIYSPLPARNRYLDGGPRQPQPMDISTPIIEYRNRRIHEPPAYIKRRRGSNSSLSEEDGFETVGRRERPARKVPRQQNELELRHRGELRMRPAVRPARNNTDSLREALNPDVTFYNELDDFEQSRIIDPILHPGVSDAVDRFFEAKVIDYPSRTRKRTRIVAWGPNGPELVSSKDKDYSIGTLFDQDRDFMAAGMINIEPYGFKPVRPTKHNTYVFYVIFGLVEVEISGTAMRLRSGSSFEVPRGNSYSIRNISRHEKARLFFVQATDTRKRKSG